MNTKGIDMNEWNVPQEALNKTSSQMAGQGIAIGTNAKPGVIESMIDAMEHKNSRLSDHVAVLNGLISKLNGCVESVNSTDEARVEELPGHLGRLKALIDQNSVLLDHLDAACMALKRL